MPEKGCTSSVSLLIFGTGDRLFDQYPGPLEMLPITNISRQYVQRLFAECGDAHFTQKFRRWFGSYSETGAGLGSTPVRAGAGESALLARDAWSRLG
jgi:hypothetical protein